MRVQVVRRLVWIKWLVDAFGRAMLVLMGLRQGYCRGMWSGGFTVVAT